MRLDLKFAAARIMGDGDDEVGYFVINGRYDAETGACSWTKTYPGSHQVWYTGNRDSRGISGTWVIRQNWSGGFAIWPGDTGEGASEHERVSEEIPEAVGRPSGVGST
jgi:hypothetical protein